MTDGRRGSRFWADVILVACLMFSVVCVGLADQWSHYGAADLVAGAFLTITALVLGFVSVRLEAGVLTLGAVPVLIAVVVLGPIGSIVVAAAANARRTVENRHNSHLPFFLSTAAWAAAGAAVHRALLSELGEALAAGLAVGVAVAGNLLITAALVWALDLAPRSRLVHRTFAASMLTAYLCLAVAGLLCAALLAPTVTAYLEVSAILFLSSFAVRSLDHQRRRDLLAHQLATADERAAFGHAMESVLHRLKNLIAIALANAEEAEDLSDLAEARRVTTVLREAADVLKRVGVQGRSVFYPSMTERDLRDIAAVAVEEVGPVARQQEVRVSLELGPAEMPVLVDVALVRDLVMNLITNAIAHAGTGGSVIVACAHRANGWPSVRVRDSGPGVAPDRLATLFASRSSDSEMGAGLGLVSAYIVARQHYGEVVYEGSLQEGGIFALVLPPIAVARQRLGPRSMPV